MARKFSSFSSLASPLFPCGLSHGQFTEQEQHLGLRKYFDSIDSLKISLNQRRSFFSIYRFPFRCFSSFVLMARFYRVKGFLLHNSAISSFSAAFSAKISCWDELGAMRAAAALQGICRRI